MFEIIVILALLPLALYTAFYIVVAMGYVIWYVGIPIAIIGLFIAAVYHAGTF